MTTPRESHVARNRLFVHGSDCGEIVRWVVVKSIGHTKRKLDGQVEFDWVMITSKNHKGGLTFNIRTDVGRRGS